MVAAGAPKTMAWRGLGAAVARRGAALRSAVRSHPLAALLVVVAVLGGGLARELSIGSNRRVSTDDIGNVKNTNAIITGRPYATFRWPPGTPFVFAVATRLDGQAELKLRSPSRSPAQYAQLLLELATLALIAVVAWSLAGPWAAVIAVVLAAAYLPLVLITRTYLSEPLGGLAFLATFAAALVARRRGFGTAALAGLIAGLACLAREDVFPAVVLIAAALAVAGWRASRGQALGRALVYLGCAILVITPWAIYASGRDGRFVPIVDGGSNALFIGTYLPGHGKLQPVLNSFRDPVCRAYPEDCRRYAQLGAAPMFDLVRARYPHMSAASAIDQAVLDNLDRYALGRPLDFAGMLLDKLWGMWSYPWSGGNSNGLHPDTSRPQHLIFVGLAWLGLIGGAVVTRRWSLITVALGLFGVTFLNVLVNAQGRDNLRLAPLLFAFGGAGLWLLGDDLWRRLRAARRPATA
ncbi:MAG: hypothetical protein ACR2KV_08280 [Solirubrobacteraceae bacterium]